MEKIAIVTDTSCDLSPVELAEYDVRCLPLSIMRADGEPFPDGNAPENVEAFYDYLADCDELPVTSQPSPLEFGTLFSELALEGYTQVLCVHIASAMSGTSNAARMGAETVGIDVRVVETNRNTWALGLIVRKLSLMRAAGADFDQLCRVAGELFNTTNIIFTVDSLKNLVKGGRTGRATGLVATLLDIKPILTVGDDGAVEQLGKARSMKRAIEKLADMAEDVVARVGAIEGYFVHVRNAAGAAKLKETFERRGIPFTEVGDFRQVGPIIATHVGLGCVGFAFTAQEA